MKSAVNRAAAVAALIVAGSAMVAAPVLAGSPKTADVAIPGGPAADYPMVLGDPFVVDGVTYTPGDTLNYDAVGYAAQGEGGAAISGSHRTLPLPSYVEVTALDSGKTVLVRLDHRGPMTGDRLIDLSAGAWAQLGLADGAKAPVRVRRVNPPEIERALLRTGQQAPARMETPKGLLNVLMRKLGGPVAPVAVAPPTTPVPAVAHAPVKGTAKPAGKGKSPIAAKPVSPKPVSSPVETPRPAVASAPEPKVAPAPAVQDHAAAQRGLYVQVAAFGEKARAETVAAAVDGSISPVGKLWRVRMGPFASRAQAEAALAKAHAKGYAGSRILTAP
ncbi:septal ring lytic transglycosylase RlpA family protein [Novosphingobium lentum]|uniref:septal ring lytic transglycosylase RlpA family protein n=1 Tax=Novosphingobium lentum TaxID=145287 RepID=UPI00082DA043|nr:SPOR domain-containing protein [Novosphingobium lentum]